MEMEWSMETAQDYVGNGLAFLVNNFFNALNILISFVEVPYTFFVKVLQFFFVWNAGMNMY
jgi:hypothetical protein